MNDAQAKRHLRKVDQTRRDLDEESVFEKRYYLKHVFVRRRLKENVFVVRAPKFEIDCKE